MTAEEQDRAAALAMADAAAELASRPLTPEQQLQVDRQDRIRRRLDHLERNRREGRI